MTFLHRKLFIILGVVLLLISIPVLLLALSQKQETQSNAADSVTLSFQPSSSNANPVQIKTGNSFSIDVMLNPGSHPITFVLFQVKFDSSRMQLSKINPFYANTKDFPVNVEGPVLGPDTLSASYAIGADPTKAITKPTKIGTLNFTALAQTNGTTSVVFTGLSRVLSAGQTDGASQNVLSTTLPAYVQISTSTAGTTPGPTGGSKTPTINKVSVCKPPLSPDSLPSAPIPTTGTILSLTLLLHGVGNAGDNPNPGGGELGNKTPVHPQRYVKVEVYDSDNKPVATSSAAVSYNTENGAFTGRIALDDKLLTGDYRIKMGSDGYLRRGIPNILKINQFANNEIPETALVAGDVNCDNALNVIDYNAMLDCGYGQANPRPIADPTSRANSPACKAHTPIENVDLDDNGIINSFDYNLFLRELSVTHGD